MKKLAEIPCQLMEKEASSAFKLAEQPYLMIIPKSILTAAGVAADNLTFELVVKDNRLSLIGPALSDSPRVMQPGIEEAAG